MNRRMSCRVKRGMDENDEREMEVGDGQDEWPTTGGGRGEDGQKCRDGCSESAEDGQMKGRA